MRKNKNLKELGDLGESWLSKKTHCDPQFIPLLVCPTILRSRNAAQIDVARVHPRGVEIFEAKNGGHLGPKQKKRLQLAADLLAIWFKRPVRLIVALSLKDYFAKEKGVI